MPRDYLKGWREIYFAKEKPKLSREAKNVIDKVIYSPRDAYNSLSADIHNVKAKADPGLIKLLKIFKQMGIASSNQYVDAMREKWQPIYKKYDDEYWAEVKRKKEQEELRDKK
jgi:hypothetical protein